jgi:hypothetical protein
MLFEGVDLTQYRKITFKTNVPSYHDIELDITSATGIGYPYINAMKGAGSLFLRVGISNINSSGYTDSYIVYQLMDIGSVPSCAISEIVIE